MKSLSIGGLALVLKHEGRVSSDICAIENVSFVFYEFKMLFSQTSSNNDLLDRLL